MASESFHAVLLVVTPATVKEGFLAQTAGPEGVVVQEPVRGALQVHAVGLDGVVDQL